MGPFEQTHTCHRGKDPGKFGHLRHVALPEDEGFGRVQTQSQVIRGDHEGIAFQFFAVLHRCKRMVIGDEVVAIPLVLKADMVLDGPEIVAQVQSPAGLDARKISDRLGS